MIVCDTRDEMLLLVQRCRPCLEVGVFAGDFSRKINDVCTPSRLVLVDAYEGQVFSCDEHGGAPRAFDGDSLHAQVQAEAAINGWSLWRARSSDALRGCALGEYEFVYIDADHSESGCRDDLEAAWPLIRGGGWLAGHDYSVTPSRCVDPRHYAGFGVKAAVDGFCAAHRVSITAIAMDGYTSFAIRKP